MVNINQKCSNLWSDCSPAYERWTLLYVGFQEALLQKKLRKWYPANEATVFFFINSCFAVVLAGSARPGIALALQNKLFLDKLVTVFAGQDKRSSKYLRKNYLGNFPPSSPFMALFKYGELSKCHPRNQYWRKICRGDCWKISKKYFFNTVRHQVRQFPREIWSTVYAKMFGSKKIPLA